MSFDADVRDAAQTMMDSIAVPIAPFEAIHGRVVLRRNATGAKTARPRRLAIAAAILLVAVPVTAYSIVSYESRERAALQAHGGWAPPRPAADFTSKLEPRVVTLSQVRSEADFRLTPPAGLPRGASLTHIEMERVGLYDGAARAWRIGPEQAIFRYRFAGGRTFEITLRRYAENTLPDRYVFEDRGPDAHGNPVLVRYETFSWRNGDQMTVATESSAFDKAEILAMARAMGGSMLALPWPGSRTTGTLQLIGN
jgi:hypothetical protein